MQTARRVGGGQNIIPRFPLSAVVSGCTAKAIDKNPENMYH